MPYFLRLGLLGFGGPVALVGQMEKELVGDRGWLTKEQMREAIAICQSMPGPLAIQVGIYVSYLRAGFWGAWAGGWAFIFPNFVIVAGLGALYVYFGDLKPVTAIFYGVSPTVIALILHSCYRARQAWHGRYLAMGDRGGLLSRHRGPAGRGGPFVHRCRHHRHRLLRQHLPSVAAGNAREIAAAPLLAQATPVASTSILGKLLLFFLKAGSLTFGSGLVIVPSYSRVSFSNTAGSIERQFLIAVAVGMISPGPVVITATFVGYLVAGFWGSLVATIGIFLPSFVFVLVAAPIVARYGGNPNVRGFVKGAYGAAIGTILGACFLLGRIAIGDWLTLLIGIASLAILFRWRVSSPLLIAATATVGLIAFPLLQPDWVMLK